MIIMSNMFRKQ